MYENLSKCLKDCEHYFFGLDWTKDKRVFNLCDINKSSVFSCL